MLRRVALGVLIAMMVGTLSNARQKAGIEGLEWISGCWVSDDGKERTEETWMKPAGQSMLGMSRTVAGGKTVFTEHIQIRDGTTGLVGELVECNGCFASEEGYPRKSVGSVSSVMVYSALATRFFRTHRPRMTLIRLTCTDFLSI